MSASAHSTEKEPGPKHIESGEKELGDEDAALTVIIAHAGDEPVTEEEEIEVLRKVSTPLGTSRSLPSVKLTTRSRLIGISYHSWSWCS